MEMKRDPAALARALPLETFFGPIAGVASILAISCFVVKDPPLPKLNQAVSTKVEPDIKVEEYNRAMGAHQRFWTNFATFMWSKPVEALRRYRYASTTMARLADMIQRDPSET